MTKAKMPVIRCQNLVAGQAAGDGLWTDHLNSDGTFSCVQRFGGAA